MHHSFAQFSKAEKIQGVRGKIGKRKKLTLPESVFTKLQKSVFSICLITDFLFGCSFENTFLYHLFSLQKTLSSNKYLRGFIELITV